MNQALVETESLTKQFANVVALNQCSLAIQAGEVFGLLGPNGAGKSTLIRLLLGFMNPTSGRAKVNGLDCHSQRVQVHESISYLPGDARIFKMMRGKDALRFFCDMRPASNLERGLMLAKRMELDLSRLVAFMSTGMRQKLALSICLASTAPLLILDEPTANLDPTVRGEILKLVLEAKSEGRTVIFSSHVLSEIEDVCDRVGILRAGELVHEQSLDELMKTHRIKARLVGELPEVPESLTSSLNVRFEDDLVQIETGGDLSPVLGWIAEANLRDVYVQPIGLRAVYDRFHQPTLAVSTETISGEA